MAPWLAFFTFPSVNVAYVLAGCVILGIAASLLGCFAFLRKRSLLGDALAHAALPGVCAAFLITGTKAPLPVLIGASFSCWAGALAIEWIVARTRCKEDSALGMVLSVFFGLGILMLTHIQNSGNAAQSGLDTFLFGQAAALVKRDVYLLGGIGALMCVMVLTAYKEFKIVSFDPDFARALGLPVRLIEFALAAMMVLAVCIGLQAVGVVLMAAMLVTPAAAARYWTDRLSIMLVLAVLFGAVSGASGAYASFLGPSMPTGPWMVIAVSTIFIISFLFAPRRGAAARLLRLQRFRRRIARENVLRTMYKFGERAQNWSAPLSPSELLQHRDMPMGFLQRTLKRLVSRGYVEEAREGMYVLTGTGVAEAERITRLHRLWELYLMRKLEIAPDHVHDDAEEIEHILTPDLERRLLQELAGEDTDPHGQQIPAAPDAAARDSKC
ncbi:MAG: metal ABC transporter permease [Candidatus Hydrogenedentes bacterium]|nr:metal ABC transporter permease [Candidatus Hydrogenedentota bacterium]